jgi:hypothetical protein
VATIPAAISANAAWPLGILDQLPYARERPSGSRRQRGDDRAEREHDDDRPRIERRTRPRAVRRHAGTLGHHCD